jgi:hypothetical protein
VEEGKRVAAGRELVFWGFRGWDRVEGWITGDGSMECVLCQYCLLKWYSNGGEGEIGHGNSGSKGMLGAGDVGMGSSKMRAGWCGVRMWFVGGGICGWGGERPHPPESWRVGHPGDAQEQGCMSLGAGWGGI